MFGTESDDEVTHNMHAPIGSAEARESRNSTVRQWQIQLLTVV
jgi:hypothetical protein